MLSPDTELLRATVSDMKVARQAIGEVNLASSHHRLALDDVALHEFLSDPRHYLIVAIREGKVLGSLYGYALRHPYRREPQFFIYGTMFAWSIGTVESEPHWLIDSSAKPEAQIHSRYGFLRITPTHQQ